MESNVLANQRPGLPERPEAAWSSFQRPRIDSAETQADAPLRHQSEQSCQGVVRRAKAVAVNCQMSNNRAAWALIINPTKTAGSMWVFARKAMFCKGSAASGLNGVGGFMIKARGMLEAELAGDLR